MKLRPLADRVIVKRLENETKLPNIQIPHRRFFTTNDPVMTPDLIDYFLIS